MSLEVVLSTAKLMSQRVKRYRMDRLKGSMKMAALLERHVEQLYEQLLTDKAPMKVSSYVSIPGTNLTFNLKAEISVDEIRSVMEQFKNLPLNQRKKSVTRELVVRGTRLLGDQLLAALPPRTADKGVKTNSRNRGHTTTTAHDWFDITGQKSIEDSVQRQVTREYFKHWRAWTPQDQYIRLFQKPALLRDACTGLIDEWDRELLLADAPSETSPLRFSDLAAMLYLKLQMDGVSESYDHFVIDEAQDIPPLMFKILHQYNPASSMTILGDLAQGIYAHQGVHAWEEFSTAIGGQAFHKESIQVSYRSTHEIVTVGSDMLQRAGATKEQLAESLRRHGELPKRANFSSRIERATYVAELVRNAQLRTNSIAIITKTVDESRLLAEELRAAGLPLIQIVDNREAQLPDTPAVIPVYLTKGLEFDTTIIADADDNNYPADELHARLLYVALTRAVHQLHICWIGEVSPFLGETPHLILEPALNGHLEYAPMTIEDFAHQRGLNANDCVRRLAALDNLGLLRDGQIDEIVLDQILTTEPAPAVSNAGITSSVRQQSAPASDLELRLPSQSKKKAKISVEKEG
jgi:DNA helicase II / ATP-dependent DNA helicase PcrA